MRRSGHLVRVQLRAWRSLWTCGIGGDGDYFAVDVPSVQAVLGLGQCCDRCSVGDPDNDQWILSPGELTQVPGGWICSLVDRHRGVPSHGDMAMGTQGDVRRIFKK